MVCDTGPGQCVPLTVCNAGPQGTTNHCGAAASCSTTTTGGLGPYCIGSSPASCVSDSDCGSLGAGYFCYKNQCVTTSSCASSCDCPVDMVCNVSGTIVVDNGKCPSESGPGASQCVPSNTNLLEANGINSQSCYGAGANSETCGGYALWSLGNPPSPLPTSIATPSISPNPQWVNQSEVPTELLKTSCPTAYAYQFDDSTSTFQCTGTSANNQPGYVITFCPSGSPNTPPPWNP